MSAPQPSAIEERRRAASRTPAALRDLDERREHRRPSSPPSAPSALSSSRTLAAAPRSRPARHAERRRPRPSPSCSPTTCRQPRTAPSRAPRVTVMSSFENAEMVANLAAGYNGQPRDINGIVRRHRPRPGQVRRRRRGGRGRLPRPRPRAAADRVASRLVHVAGARPRRRRRLRAGRRRQRRVVQHRARDARSRSPSRSAGTPSLRPGATSSTPPSDANLWSDLGHPEWGAFKLGKTSPIVATSGEAAMFASFGTAAGSVDDLSASAIAEPAVQSIRREHELATSHYMATPEHFLWHARQADEKGSAADFLSAVIVDEKSVWDYNRGITSRDGVTRVEGDASRGEARPDLPHRRLLRRRQPRRRADRRLGRPERGGCRRGLHPLRRHRPGPGDRPRVGLPRPERDAGRRRRRDVAKLVADPEGVLPLPGQDVVAAVNKAFPEVRKRAQVLFLMDVSGSMDEPISASDTKLTAAKAPSHRPSTTSRRATTSASRRSRRRRTAPCCPATSSPIADIGDSRDAFLGALGGLQSMGDTPLYQAVDTFAAQQAQSWSPDRITAIVLLSDGENDAPNAPTIGADTMLANLQDLHHDTPVLSSPSPTGRMPTSPRCSRSRARPVPTTTTPRTRSSSRRCSATSSRASDLTRRRRASW